mgnify:CR=1 FL=1
MKKFYVAVLVIVFSFILSIYLYPRLPEMIASHWDLNGNVNGYMNKFWGVFMLPIVLTGILILFSLIPKIDPLRKNIEKFRKYFDRFILMIVFFMSYVYILTIAWNLGYRFNMNLMMAPAIGALMFFIGGVLEKAERNWFIGIRNPWTLSSDKVWKKTHKIGGKLFKLFGVAMLIGLLFNNMMFWIVLIGAVGLSLFLFVYSYVIWKNEK